MSHKLGDLIHHHHHNDHDAEEQEHDARHEVHDIDHHRAQGFDNHDDAGVGGGGALVGRPALHVECYANAVQ